MTEEKVTTVPEDIGELLATPGLKGAKATLTGVARGVVEEYTQGHHTSPVMIDQYSGFLQQGNNFLEFGGGNYGWKYPTVRGVVSMLKASSETDTEITLSGELHGDEGDYGLQVKEVIFKGYRSDQTH